MMSEYFGLFLSIWCAVFLLSSAQVDLQHCRNPLGMQDKRIPDDHLTASSFHARGTGPRYARLDREEGDGAWCPKGILEKGQEDQYLQVKLPSLSFLTIIATQGRDASGRGQEYTPSYKLNYSRDGVTWKQWGNFRGDSVLTGNRDSRTAQRQLLNPGIPSVRYVRLIPVTSRPKAVCARIELYGCRMTSGIVSYEMPRPGVVSKDGDALKMDDKWSFSDESYDGYQDGVTWFGGLGQITDGVMGSKNIAETKSMVATREIGFDYVGWQNNNGGDRYVTMTFNFEEVRNFTTMKIHCLSASAVGAKFFSNIQVSFSLNGQTFPNSPYAPKVAFDVPESSAPTDDSRLVTVPLSNAMARYVRARFRIRGEWLLISEVEFEADVVGRDPDPDLMYPELPAVEVLLLPVTVDMSYGAVSSTIAKGVGEFDGSVDVSTEPSATPSGSNTAVIVCSLIAVIALLLLIVGVLVIRQRRLKKTMTPPRYTYTSGNSLSGTTRASVALCIPEQTVTLAPTACPFPEKSADPMYHEIAGAGVSTGDYLQPNDVIQTKYHLPEVTQLAQQSMGRDRRFEQPDVTMCASGVRDGVMTIPHYAETEVRALPPPYATPLQGPFGNNVYAVPWGAATPVPTMRAGHVKDKRGTPPKYTATPSEASTLLADDSQDDLGFTVTSLSDCDRTAVEFPRERLEFIERLGEGQFGEVRLCKADACLRKYVKRSGITLGGSPGSSVLVAVKVLRDDATPNAKEDFLKEVKVMSQLRDPNIVQLIAVCTEDEPYAMITEYMQHGDLNQYLKDFDVDESSYRTHNNRLQNSAHSSNQPECSSQLPTISCGVLMSMAAQIASGMKYLSSLNFVHRDLATRNCLVGANHTIRIADFGMSRNMYQADYYKIQGKAVLPIRWMSWECILLGKFSTASDVWAFGVTLWEIFTLCKCQPYHALDDKEVIENMHHIYQRTGEEVYLPKPKACPTTVFNMVRQCWKRECTERPTFEQLFSFLRERQ